MPATENTAETTCDESATGGDAKSRLVGRLLSGKWRVDRLLSTGGMSLVYSATHRNGKRVALKVLRPELSADPRTKRRFLREGYLVNRVPHDGVVPVLDDNESEDGLVFLVMELLDGATLDELSRDAVCEPAEVAHVAGGVLDILTAAHRAGVVHRDVKPGNVFLTRKGVVRLLDFGIARHRGALENATRDGAVLGTPGYMAPEQARGHWDQVDERTDVWAVGATMFRLLTGRRVHEGATSEEYMIAAATQPAAPIASVRADVPGPLAAVVDRALRFDAKERWGSAEEMLAELERARAGLPPHRWEALRLPDAEEEQPRDASPGVPTMTYFDGTRPFAPIARSKAMGWAARAAVALGAGAVLALGSRWFAPEQEVQKDALGAPTARAADPARLRPPESHEAEPRARMAGDPGRDTTERRDVEARPAPAPARSRARSTRDVPSAPAIPVLPAPVPSEAPRPDDARAPAPVASSVPPLEVFLDERR